MQHLNDDMDELFRKAADEYPLNTGTPDWNKVAQGLAEEHVPEPRRVDLDAHGVRRLRMLPDCPQPQPPPPKHRS